MQQSSQFSSGFASIAESFRPDTKEAFESKAKAIATHIGMYHISPSMHHVLCASNFLLTGAPLREMVDVVVRASGEARVAQTVAFGTATENVIKALGTIYKDIEVRVRACMRARARV